ncbi:hypothetical protein QE152_g4214 [Popillia japonica]|uniref:Uncharacterized protein n=1 Tax=Popillia japonica TaxID=7064 RepID=A0AAW1MZH5_POPJA
MSEEDNLGNVLFEWATNSEFQAIFLVGCTCVGIWVLIKWIMQLVFSVLWPFFLVVAILIVMPGWRRIVVKDVLPKHIETIKSFTHKFALNSTPSQ